MEKMYSILRQEADILREWGKKTGAVHEKDLQALHFGFSLTEEDRSRRRERFEAADIRIISGSEGGSLFFPHPEELTEIFREDDAVTEYLRQLQKEGFDRSLTPEQETDLVSLGRETALVEGNLLRVVSIARQYVNQGMAPRELILAGNQALVDAVRTWPEEKDCPITLYLIYHIGRGICAELAWPEEKGVRNIMETLREQMAEAPDQDAIFRRQNSRLPVIGENPILSRLKLRVVEYPDLVSPREMEVIRLRLGLTDGTVHTVDQVAEQFGITPERVAQIENGFLRRVRVARRRKMQQYFSEIPDLHESPEFGKTDPGI